MDSFRDIFYFLLVIVGIPIMMGIYIANPEEFVFDIFGIIYIIFICWIIIGWIKNFFKNEI